MRVYMQIPAFNGKPPRYYQLVLQEDLINGWTLVREWGQQGYAGRVKRDHFPDRAAAEAALLQSLHHPHPSRRNQTPGAGPCLYQ